VLLRTQTKELLDATDICKLVWTLHCDGQSEPNTYTIAQTRKMRRSPTVNVDQLKPFHLRTETAPVLGAVRWSLTCGRKGYLVPRPRRRGDGGGKHRQTTGGWGAVGLMTCCTARRRWPSPGWGPPRPLRFPVRCPFGGPGGIWCSTAGQPEWRASSEWVTVGPRYCDWTQPCRRLLARGNGVVRPHLCPRIVTAQLAAGFSSGSRCPIRASRERFYCSLLHLNLSQTVGLSKT
jgi:hypothetical protein